MAEPRHFIQINNRRSAEFRWECSCCHRKFRFITDAEAHVCLPVHHESPALTDEGATQPVSGQGRADAGEGREE